MKKKRLGPLLLVGVVTLLAALVAGCADVPPTLDYSPSGFEFGVKKEGPDSQGQVLAISNTGGEMLHWSVSSDVQWLKMSPTSGSSGGEVDEVEVVVDISGMSAGDYNGNIGILAPGATNPEETIPVALVISSVWREEVLQVDCTLGRCCEESMSFSMEEGEEIHLWWLAYGDAPLIATFLESPDGTCYAGYAGTMTGTIDRLVPAEHCRFFREPFGHYAYDVEKSGNFVLYCSGTYSERTASFLFPPGEYRLKFDVVAEEPYYSKGKEGDPTRTTIKVRYRIE